MCNRYEQIGTISQIRLLEIELERELLTTSRTGNLPPQANVYPDQDAPVVRNRGPSLELAMLRWGVEGVKPKETLQNIRNPSTAWWRKNNGDYLVKPEYRCLVPFTAFAEPVVNSTWFVMPGHPVAYFAGIWRPWHGERLMPVEGKARRQRVIGDYELFAFLTTDANDVVRPIHEKAMPSILLSAEDKRDWLAGGEDSLKRLQRPLGSDQIQIRVNEGK